MKEKASATAVAEFLKVEEDGSYEARIAEFLEVEEGEAEEGKAEENEGTFEKVDESYWTKVNAFAKEEGESYDGAMRHEWLEFIEAEEGEAEENKAEENEGTFEKVDESYWPKVNAFGKEEGES